VCAQKREQLQGDGHGRRGAHGPHPDARAGEAVDRDVQERAERGGLWEGLVADQAQQSTLCRTHLSLTVCTRKQPCAVVDTGACGWQHS